MLCLNLHLAVIKWVMRKSQEIHSKISSFIQLWEKIQSEIGNLLCDVLTFLWFKVLKYFCVRWPELGKWIGNVATLTERTVCMVTNCSIHFTGKKLAICIICIWILLAWIIWAGNFYLVLTVFTFQHQAIHLFLAEKFFEVRVTCFGILFLHLMIKEF